MKIACWLKVWFVVGILCAAGCASAPTKGDLMLSQGETAQELSKQWNSGQKMLAEGEALKKKGEKLIEDGKAKVEQGEDDVDEAEDLISEGKELMEKSEKAFATKFPQHK